jgi:hypothetical protein
MPDTLRNFSILPRNARPRKRPTEFGLAALHDTTPGRE